MSPPKAEDVALLSDAEFAEAMVREASGIDAVFTGRMGRAVEMLREAARRLSAPAAPRVGGAGLIEQLIEFGWHKRDCKFSVASSHGETGCTCGWFRVLKAALSAPPAASADERAKVFAMVMHELPDQLTDAADKITDAILAAGYRKAPPHG